MVFLIVKGVPVEIYPPFVRPLPRFRKNPSATDSIHIMKTRRPEPAVVTIPPKWQRFYGNLRSLRESLQEDHVERMSKILVVLERAGSDVADDASEQINHAMSLGILTRDDNALDEVDSAIERILEGTYGICEKTGKPIPLARLRVVPWTRFTREALEQIERERATSPLLLNSLGRSRSTVSETQTGKLKPDFVPDLRVSA